MSKSKGGKIKNTNTKEENEEQPSCTINNTNTYFQLDPRDIIREGIKNQKNKGKNHPEIKNI